MLTRLFKTMNRRTYKTEVDEYIKLLKTGNDTMHARVLIGTSSAIAMSRTSNVFPDDTYRTAKLYPEYDYAELLADWEHAANYWLTIREEVTDQEHTVHLGYYTLYITFLTIVHGDSKRGLKLWKILNRGVPSFHVELKRLGDKGGHLSNFKNHPVPNCFSTANIRVTD